MGDRLTMVHTPEHDGATGYYRDPTPADIAAHVAALPAEERVDLMRKLVGESDDLEAVLSCQACGRALELQVQPREHDGFGHETAPRRAWLECMDGECILAGVPRGGKAWRHVERAP